MWKWKWELGQLGRRNGGATGEERCVDVALPMP